MARKHPGLKRHLERLGSGWEGYAFTDHSKEEAHRIIDEEIDLKEYMVKCIGIESFFNTPTHYYIYRKKR